MMDKNEVITLSSDDESEFSQRLENHSTFDIICIDETPIDNALSPEKKSDLDHSGVKEEDKKSFHDLPLGVVKINEENITTDINNTFKPFRNDNEIDEECNQNLKLFTELVEYCGSLEKNPNDRVRLTKKLMKRYGEADCNYIKSQEFKNLIEKCRDKVKTYNLYIIAKEITDELSYKKKFENAKKSNQVEKANENSQTVVENNEKVKPMKDKFAKNRTKFINKIVKKLDLLGSKIRELETKEVDLSDEEESSYVQLQRYRERFCQIYKKLCKYTNEVTNSDLLYNRRICFSESKYPAINKCIENWLNKTKTFPDFSDIMKLLESQSSSLGLPTNRESIRAIAIEIFQQVGVMLQRRRIYDLWDSFCGFLDDTEDPANSDPTLDKVLKSNFEARIKKEQEIFQYFAELQEKERLEPEEVPDEEANRSPVESGNEDYIEIEEIENFQNKKLDDAINKETKEKGNNLGNSAWNASREDENDSEKKARLHHSSKVENSTMISKESKNNFRNCKSLKWKLESGAKMASVNSKECNAGTEDEKEKEKEIGNSKGVSSEINKFYHFDLKDECKKPEKSEKNCSNSNVPALKNIKLGSEEAYNKVKIERIDLSLSPSKKAFTAKLQDENLISKKKKFVNPTESKSFIGVFNTVDENDDAYEKTKNVFNVHCCHIFTNSTFENLNEKEKDWGKRKVFRDLTNLNRLMELHGKRKKMPRLFSPSFSHPRFCRFGKFSWKKRFKVGLKFIELKGQKRALNQEEESGKIVNSGKDAEKKNIRNNSKSGRNEGKSFFSGHGNGSEEDNNEDKNDKNWKSIGDVNENQFEEDEDEEENEADKDENKIDTEIMELPFPNKKTEGSLGIGKNYNIPSAIQNNLGENEESVQLFNAQSKTPSWGPKSGNENKNESVEQSKKSGHFIKRKLSRENQKNNCCFNEGIEFKIEEFNSEIERDVRNIQGEYVESECSKSVSKTVMRNSKADAKNNTMENEKSNLIRQKSEMKRIEIASDEELNGNNDVEIVLEVKAHQTTPRQIAENKSANTWKPVQFDMAKQELQKKNTFSTSDDEIVKRFLMSSPASISITPPRKLCISKSPSQDIVRALVRLRNLKGVSATLVRSKPKNEDDVILIGDSCNRRVHENSDFFKRRRTDIPVISDHQSVVSTTPKIVTVQGNVSGFENQWPEIPDSTNSECTSSSIRISNVWGSLPDSFMESVLRNEPITPGYSFQQNNPVPSNSVKKKKSKKTVEYVVLE